MYFNRRKLFTQSIKASVLSSVIGGPSVLTNPSLLLKGASLSTGSFSAHLQLQFKPKSTDHGFLDFDRETLKWEDKSTFLSTIDRYQKNGSMAYTCRMRTDSNLFTKNYFFTTKDMAEKFIAEITSNGAIRLVDLANADFNFNYTIQG